VKSLDRPDWVRLRFGAHTVTLPLPGSDRVIAGQTPG
jgi:hypothetical protein